MTKRLTNFSDAQKYKILCDAQVRVACRGCHQWTSLAEIEFDHIVALIHKGANDPKNGQPLCGPCHKKKQQLTLRLMQKLNESSESEMEHGGKKEGS